VDPFGSTSSPHGAIRSASSPYPLNIPAPIPALRFKKDVDPYLQQLVRSYKGETLQLAKEANEGEVIVKARPLASIAMELVKLARPGDTIFATNYGVLFDSPQGNIVRQLFFDRVAEGVHVTRVFIEGLTATHDDKKRLREEMDRQKEHLHVRFVKESQLPPEARNNSLILFGRYAAYANYVKLSGASKGQLVDEIKINTRPDALAKAKELADAIIKLSEEYK